MERKLCDSDFVSIPIKFLSSRDCQYERHRDNIDTIMMKCITDQIRRNSAEVGWGPFSVFLTCLYSGDLQPELGGSDHQNNLQTSPRASDSANKEEISKLRATEIKTRSTRLSLATISAKTISATS